MENQNNTFNEFCACLIDDKGAREQTPIWVRKQFENGTELSDLLEQIKQVAEEYPHWGLHAIAAIVDLGDDPDSPINLHDHDNQSEDADNYNPHDNMHEELEQTANYLLGLLQEAGHDDLADHQELHDQIQQALAR